MNNIPKKPTDYKELGRTACPVCGHKGRCKADSTGSRILCFRLADPEVNGFRFVKKTGECSTYVMIGSSADRNGGALGTRPKAVPPSSAAAKPTLESLAATYTAAITDARLTKFAHELGVTTASLRRMGAGLNGGRLCFPERDSTGQVIGISTRFPNQKPKYLVGDGHRRGLLIPSDLPAELIVLLFPEGPSDTIACLDMGLFAVGRPNNGSKADLIAEFAGKVPVPIILGENDEKPDGTWPGRDGAIRIAADVANSLGRPVLWALAPPGFKDARDFLNANKTRDPLEIGRELLAHVFATATAVEPSGGNDGGEPGGAKGIWPDPKPLPTELPPVYPFDLDLLPDALCDWVRDIAERAQCPADFPAVGAMVGLSSLLGRKVAIRPKRRDDWTVIANLWGGVIGRPGLLKTPMLQEATKPLRRLEADAKVEFERQFQEFEAKKIVRKAQRDELKRTVKEAVQSGENAEEIAISGLRQESNDRPPVRVRYLVNDTTVEKLGELLNENPNGILMFRDELIGFLRTLGKDGHECDRAFYLEAWDGKGRFTYDRIGRGTIDMDSAIVSILGGIQPAVLHTFLRSSLDQVGNDGLIQRFQLLVWPDVSKQWVNIDEWPDTAAKNRAYAVFTALSQLTPVTVGAEIVDDGIPFLRFDAEAQAVFDDWRETLERRLRSDELHPILEEHLSKYRSLIPSLALLIHLIDGGVGPVGLASLDKAIRWGEYLESHAKRVFYAASNPDISAAAALARKIVKGELANGFTLHEVHRHEWSGLSDRDILQGAADLLCDLDWLLSTKEQTGGAPKIRFWINPKIARTHPKAPVKTDNSPENDLSSVLTGPFGEGDDGNRDADVDRIDDEVQPGPDSITRTPTIERDDGNPTLDSNGAVDPPGMAEAELEFRARFDPTPQSLELWRANYRREHGGA